MAWTAPMTAVSNTTFTAAQFNTHVRDNLNETAPAKATSPGTLFVGTGPNSIEERFPASALVTASESTASAVFTNLTTAGPSVTVTTGVAAIIFLSARIANDTTNAQSIMSYEITGASAVSPANARAINIDGLDANNNFSFGSTFYHNTLTPGVNTFTAQYAAGSGTATFDNRRLTVIPL